MNVTVKQVALVSKEDGIIILIDLSKTVFAIIITIYCDEIKEISVKRYPLKHKFLKLYEFLKVF